MTGVPLVKRHSCVIASEFHTVCCRTGELEILDADLGISLCRGKVGRGIGSFTASEPVRSLAAGEGVVAAFARQDVIAITAEQPITARAAFQLIVIAATTNHIVAASGGDLIPAVGADDHVCAGGAIELACVRLAVIRPTDDDALIVDVDGGCLAVAHRGSRGRHELEGPNVAGRALRPRGAKLIGGGAASVRTRVNGRAAGQQRVDAVRQRTEQRIGVDQVPAGPKKTGIAAVEVVARRGDRPGAICGAVTCHDGVLKRGRAGVGNATGAA